MTPALGDEIQPFLRRPTVSAAAAALLGLDLAISHLILLSRNVLDGGMIVSGLLDFRYAWNKGVSFCCTAVPSMGRANGQAVAFGLPVGHCGRRARQRRKPHDSRRGLRLFCSSPGAGAAVRVQHQRRADLPWRRRNSCRDDLALAWDGAGPRCRKSQRLKDPADDEFAPAFA